MLGERVWFVPHSGCLNALYVRRKGKLSVRTYPDGIVAFTIKSIRPSSEWGDRFVVAGEGLSSEVNASLLIRALDGHAPPGRPCGFERRGSGATCPYRHIGWTAAPQILEAERGFFHAVRF
jgi:hypothetical protein